MQQQTLMNNLKLVGNETFDGGRVVPVTLTKRLDLRERFVTASYTDPADDSIFATDDYEGLLRIINPFLKLAGYAELENRSEEATWTTWKWAETTHEGASMLLRNYLHNSQIYDVEIRNVESVESICDTLLANRGPTRYLSNHGVRWDGDVPVNNGLEGDAITDHTFEFTLLILTPTRIQLFVSWEED